MGPPQASNGFTVSVIIRTAGFEPQRIKHFGSISLSHSRTPAKLTTMAATVPPCPAASQQSQVAPGGVATTQLDHLSPQQLTGELGTPGRAQVEAAPMGAQESERRGPPCLCVGSLATCVWTVRKGGVNCGREFFGCVKPGHDPTRCNFFAWVLPLPDDVATPVCVCTIPTPAAVRQVRKEGPNYARLFFACAQPLDSPARCNFFEWVDDVHVARSTLAEGPSCACADRLPAETYEVRKDGPTKGRPFLACGKPLYDSSRCDYFAWADGAGPPCTCGVPTIQATVQKDGPNHNRHFHRCPRNQSQSCGFFAWVAEADDARSRPY